MLKRLVLAGLVLAASLAGGFAVSPKPAHAAACVTADCPLPY